MPLRGVPGLSLRIGEKPQTDTMLLMRPSNAPAYRATVPPMAYPNTEILELSTRLSFPRASIAPLTSSTILPSRDQ